jgi:hypothetical protein
MKLLGLAFLTFLILGCEGDKGSSEGLPSNEFGVKSEYSLSDFSLNNDYKYWEVRIRDVGSDPEYPDEVLMSFDEDSFMSLSETQKLNLENAGSDIGFSAQCLPGYCPIYGVAIIEDSTILLTSKGELSDFFGEINTIAELHVWLWANDYASKYYEKVDSGYMVVVSWDSLCGTRGMDLVFVDYNGSIAKQETISTENYEGCL